MLLGDAQYTPLSGAIALPYAGAFTQSFRWNAAANDMVSVLASSYPFDPVMVASGNAFSWEWSVAGDDYHLTTPAVLISEKRLASGGGGDVMYGGLGNDWLAGQTGDDYLEGGDGNDSLYGDDKDGLMTAADQGDDVVLGGAGNDLLFGGAGDDILGGGPGDDTVYGGVGQDLIFFNRGDGHDTVFDPDLEPGTTLIFGAGISRDDITLHLGSLALDLGNGDEIHIEGFNPNDVFNSASVSVFGFADGTALTLASLLARGFDLNGAATDDSLTGTNTVDRIQGLAGNDTLVGGAGDDVLNGGAGNDALIGGLDVDTADYSTASAGVKVNLGLATAQNTYGSGYDTLTAVENLTGSSFNDYLVGTKNGNVITGGLGADYLFGKSGADRFVFNQADSGITPATRDTIADFNAAEADKIDLSQIDADTVTAGRQAFNNDILSAFDAVNATGQLVFDAVNHVLYGSMDADPEAEFAIVLNGVNSLTAASLILA